MSLLLLFTPTGAATHEKTGVMVTGTVARGTDVFEAVEAGKAVAGSRLLGADVLEDTRAGNAVAGTRLTGIDSVELPSQGTATVGHVEDYAALVMALTPALYWRMTESAATVLDSSGNSRTGTMTGNSVQNAEGLLFGEVGGGGSGGFFQLGDLLTLISGIRADSYKPYTLNSQRTLVALIAAFSDTPAWTVFGGSGTGGAANAPHPTLELFKHPSLPFYNIARFYPTVNTFPVGWVDFNISAMPIDTVAHPVHMALTFDDSTGIAELFLGGVSMGQRGPLDSFGVALHYDTITDPGYFQIGYRGDGSTFESSDGWFDEVAVFESILTAAQIRRLALAAGNAGGLPGGADVYQAVETGKVLATSKSAGLATKEMPGKAGVVTADTLPLGADVFEAVETGKAIATAKQAGTSAKEAPGKAGELVVGGNAYAAAVLGDSAQGYWRLGELSGTVARDELGSNDGTYVNTPTFGVAGLAGPNPAVSFDHLSSEELTLPGNLMSTNGAFELWFTWTFGAVLVRDNTSSGGWMFGMDNSGTFAVRIAGTTLNTSVSAATAANGARHHLVVNKTGANVEVWLDGVSIASSGGFANTSSVTPWHVARSGTTANYSDMKADEIAFYPAALTSDRIKLHYRLGQNAGALLNGADVYEAVETGTNVAGTRVAGADIFEGARTGALVAGTRVAGADVFEAARSGTNTAGTRLAGAEGFEANKSGTNTAGTLARGPVQAGFISKLGTVVAGSLVSGADVFTATETGAAVTLTRLVGSDQFTATETGAVVAGTVLGGTSTGIVAGARQLGHLTVTVTWIPRPEGLLRIRAQGSTAVVGMLTAQPAPLVRQRAQGVPTLSGRVLPVGLVHGRALGVAAVNPRLLTPAALTHTRALGSHTLTIQWIARPVSLRTDRALGLPTTVGQMEVGPPSLLRQRAMGDPNLSAYAKLGGLVHGRALGEADVNARMLQPMALSRV